VLADFVGLLQVLEIGQELLLRDREEGLVLFRHFHELHVAVLVAVGLAAAREPLNSEVADVDRRLVLADEADFERALVLFSRTLTLGGLIIFRASLIILHVHVAQRDYTRSISFDPLVLGIALKQVVHFGVVDVVLGGLGRLSFLGETDSELVHEFEDKILVHLLHIDAVLFEHLLDLLNLALVHLLRPLLHLVNDALHGRPSLRSALFLVVLVEHARRLTQEEGVGVLVGLVGQVCRDVD